MSNLKEIVDAEIAKRVAKMSTDELLALRNEEAPKRKRRAPATAAPRGNYSITVSAAVLDAVAAKWLDSSSIVEAVQQVRPGTPEPTIRADISRQAKRGTLKRDEKNRFRAIAKR
jgi:hypothetical protein